MYIYEKMTYFTIHEAKIILWINRLQLMWFDCNTSAYWEQSYSKYKYRDILFYFIINSMYSICMSDTLFVPLPSPIKPISFLASKRLKRHTIGPLTPNKSQIKAQSNKQNKVEDTSINSQILERSQSCKTSTCNRRDLIRVQVPKNEPKSKKANKWVSA